MSDLRDLYQEVILDHNKSPKNFKVLPAFTHKAEGYNPLCGDQCTIYLQLENNQVRDISFQGNGCAISKASASVMTSALKETSIEDAQKLFHTFHQIVTGELPSQDSLEGKLKKLAAFFGVRDYPARVKCATLAWHTFNAALQNQETPISTE